METLSSGCRSAPKMMAAEILLILLQFPPITSKLQAVDCKIHISHIIHRFYQPGKFIYGGILYQSTFFPLYSRGKTLRYDNIVLTENYQHILALAFAVKEINENSQLLPNITLGFDIYNSQVIPKWIYHATLHLISPKNNFVPNYKCSNEDKLLAVIEEMASAYLNQIPHILAVYKVPQLLYWYGAVNAEITSHLFYDMVPKGTQQYRGILLLLQHFNWQWIGLITADAMILEWFIKNVLPDFSRGGICIAVMESFHNLQHSEKESYIKNSAKLYDKLMNSNSNVLVFSGDTHRMTILRWLLRAGMEQPMQHTKGKVWILSFGMELKHISGQTPWETQDFHGSISFSFHTNELPGFQQFLQSRNPFNALGDGFIKDFWTHAFGCTFPDPAEGDISGNICNGEESLQSLPNHMFPKSMTWQSYSIYNAVYVIAHALHTIYSSTSLKRIRRMPLDFHPWQLNYILKSVSFNNAAGEKISFDDNKEQFPGFDIINWVTFPNQSFFGMKVGRMNPKAATDEEFTINDHAMIWHNWFNQAQPVSLCNVECLPGYRKKKKEGEHFCCYDCIVCPQGWISNITDMADCFKCPEDQYPSKKQNICIPKIVTFLSYEEPLGISLSSSALSFSCITALILGVFIKHRETPIVKANDADLTYVLLFSLLLCFLSALLFIGQPRRVTCLLRQVAFGITFTMAISAILAKNITVILAFLITQPGSWMKKWMGKKMTRSIVLSCCMIQAGICFVWLLISPPFPDSDLHSLPKEIVLQCNDSSPIMFYFVLSYMGLLAMVSFIVAFHARKLPDGFNETKFIIFSMLAFCSVWLSFLPAYLSIKEKYAPAVECFSILASGAGLLAFIFFPKVYIILWKPELNKREYFRRR